MFNFDKKPLSLHAPPRLMFFCGSLLRGNNGLVLLRSWMVPKFSPTLLASKLPSKLDTQHPEEMDVSRDEEEFRAVNHAEKTLHKIENYWKEKKLCDVILIAGNMRIPAHRLVLMAMSDFFAVMFTINMREAIQEEVKVEGIDPNSLNSLVQYAYTGVLQLKEDTIENLLGAACFLQLTEVIEVCSNFLIKQLHPSNCLGILSFGDAQGCTELLRLAHKYTMEHFIEVIKNEEFPLLPANGISKLLGSDDVNVPDEETIFNAVMQWVGYDVQARKQDLPVLLSYIRLPLLPPQLLVDLEESPVFTADLQCQKLLIEAMKYHLLPERKHMLQSPRTKPRISTLGALYAVGCKDTIRGTHTIEKYDLRTNSWLHSSTMSSLRFQFGVAVIGNKLYVLGGRYGSKTLNTVECFDPASKIWTVMPPMSTPRHGLGVATLEGLMYAVGGHDGSNYLNTVERWDSEGCQWTYVASMSTPRSSAGVATLEGPMYAVGGHDGSNYLYTVERWDPEGCQWTYVASMSIPRSSAGVATLEGLMYAVGGHDGSNYLNTVERWDSEGCQWTYVASMSTPRSSAGVVALNG
ncbi:Kelch-like protein 4, partial [Manis javanica]